MFSYCILCDTPKTKCKCDYEELEIHFGMPREDIEKIKDRRKRKKFDPSLIH